MQAGRRVSGAAGQRGSNYSVSSSAVRELAERTSSGVEGRGSVFRVRWPRPRALLSPPRKSKWVGSKVRVNRPSFRRLWTRSTSFPASSLTDIHTPGVIPGYSAANWGLSRASRTFIACHLTLDRIACCIATTGGKFRPAPVKLEPGRPQNSLIIPRFHCALPEGNFSAASSAPCGSGGPAGPA